MLARVIRSRRMLLTIGWPSWTRMIGSLSVSGRSFLKRNVAQLTATESTVIAEITISVPVTDSSLWMMPCWTRRRA